MIRNHARHEESYELNETNLPDADDFEWLSDEDEDEDESRANLLNNVQDAFPQRQTLVERLLRYLPYGLRSRRTRGKRVLPAKRQRMCLRPSFLRRIITGLLASVFAILAITATFFPSYTNPPAHYNALRNRAAEGDSLGRANVERQKIFIAASIFDKGGHLADGPWGKSVLSLIDILGPENVYLSIYENDAGPEAEAALQNLGQKVTCDHTIAFDKHLSLDDVPHVTLPDGSKRTKRIVYLSEVRNRALKPLQSSSTRYDKLLYINDVIFDPVEAAQLLFSTNTDSTGRANYRAACAVDFINPFKYYDTFATRDYEGFGIGLPFFPWFTSAGGGVSKGDVFAGSDAVRVRSCWGGMVAFDARFFQNPSIATDVPKSAGSESPSNMTVPYQFRAEDDLYWDASECCLIHADIQDPDPSQSGIYMNPYVRVAYDKTTLSWLGFTRRFEKAYAPVHYAVSKIVGMPWYNPRQSEHAWDRVDERVWVSDPTPTSGGSFEMISRTASHSGFCGRRALQVLKMDITSPGKNWEFLPIPE